MAATGEGLSLRAYAAHRGCSAPSVLRAIRAGRLKNSLTRDKKGFAKITDIALADQEWEANTDLTKAPAYVKERAASSEPAPLAHAAGNQVLLEPQPHGGALKRTVAPPADPNEPAPAGETLSDASAREKHWKAKRAELDYRKAAGELVVAADIAKELETMLANVRTKLLGVPSKFKARFMDTPYERIETLDTLIREVLLDLSADSPAAIPDAEADGDELPELAATVAV